MSDDEDSLAVTRSRRANAGSRMKQLIELEAQSTEHLSQFVTEDDENVNLLFQETANDEEFIDEELDDEDLEDEDEEEQPNGESGEKKESRKRSRSDNEGEGEGEEDEEEDNDEEDDGPVVNSDDVLSDSDLSMSDEDESEGEKELQKQERLKKKRKKVIIPTIKKATITTKKTIPKPSKKTHLVTSDSLLLSERRSSSRSAALESKHALVEKLKQSEQRRSQMAPVVRVKVVEKTQEERLAEAVETERVNVESLHRFREQEIFKKEKQKQMFLSKRRKLRNVVRLVSQETYITPVEEIEYYKKMYEQNKRRRTGRKKKTQGDEPEPYTMLYGEVDMDLPLVKQELEQQRLENERLEQERKEQEEKELKIKEEQKEDIVEEKTEDQITEDQITEDQITEDQKVEGEKEEEKEEEDKKEDKKEEEQVIEDKKEVVKEQNEEEQNEEERKEEKEEKEDHSNEAVPEQIKTENKIEDIETVDLVSADSSMDIDANGSSSIPKDVTEDDTIINETLAVTEDEGETAKSSQNGEAHETIESENSDQIQNGEAKSETPIKEDTQEVSPPLEEADVNTSANGHASLQENGEITEDKTEEVTQANGTDTSAQEGSPEKKVKFADLPEDVKEETASVDKEETASVDKEETSVIEKEETPATDIETPVPEQEVKDIFEGPPQRVARNTIYLLDFEEDNRDMRLSVNNIKSILFGAESLLPASRRFKDVKTILKIGDTGNPYETTGKSEDNSVFEPVSKLTADDAIFDELRRLPRLGVKQDVIETVEDVVKTEDTAIVINTEAPTGLYLPNGNKKNCLISGTEVKYFDPSTGIPYSSVETYRLVKLIESGQIPWYSLTEDMNDTGVVEIYLGSRDGSVKHAKGVPQGFEG
ncbi:uncharacterized protein RJT21DRAFT_2707 [Scheffersomyces amazonensis]|uniref:uncharacterized protein n=1 Tax=Scheffersomyces amazonensis TaxID=1078765 RepID=UPI00315CFCF2